MDIFRPELAVARKRRRLIISILVVVALAGVTYGVTRLEPAAPEVERAAIVIDTVKRGEMLRQVRGTGTLVPENIRLIAATTDGRVDRVLFHPGTTGKAGTIT